MPTHNHYTALIYKNNNIRNSLVINSSYFYDDLKSYNNLEDLKYDFRVDNIDKIFKYVPKIFIYSNIK